MNFKTKIKRLRNQIFYSREIRPVQMDGPRVHIRVPKINNTILSYILRFRP